MKAVISFLLLSACALNSVDAARILVAFPMPSKSHTILGNAVVKALLKEGHEITYITPIPMKDPPSNLRQVDLSSNMDLVPKDLVNIKNILEGKFSTRGLTTMYFMFHFITKGSIFHENVQALINDPTQKFDAVIVEYMFNSMYAGFSQVFQCPLMWFSSVEPNGVTLRLIDEYPNPSYVPELSFEYVPPLTFWQRAAQLLNVIKMTAYRLFFTMFLDNPAYKEAFGPAAAKRGIELPHLNEAEYTGSLILGNSHVSIANAVKLPQNYKPIGGYHIDNNTKPLPEDLQILMDNSKEGVIYFSMGSNLKSKDWPESIKSGLVKMFGQLKQTVIWKFEEVLPNLPKNLHIVQWAPQQSILAHPNCKIFITHGGLLSVTETIHFGVPIIGIPAFADQFSNVNKAVVSGFGKEVSLSYDLPEKMKLAIDDVLNNPSYRTRVKELSFIYHDRPVPPAKEMVHWVNHVIKTKGAPHLRSPALSVPLYQKLYLDLLALILAVLYVLYRGIKLVFSSRKEEKVKVN